MSVGEILAQERLDAGLTIPQVARLTCIRETIIREIEHDDTRRCGGDFYARGHIRAIAAAVGTDPAPLIARYDTAHAEPDVDPGFRGSHRARPEFRPGPGAAAPEPACSVPPDSVPPGSAPSGSVLPGSAPSGSMPPGSAPSGPAPGVPAPGRSRARLNWSLAMSLALLVAVSFGGYKVASHFLLASSPAAGPARADGVSASQPALRPEAYRTRHLSHHHAVVIELTASGPCWVELATRSGHVLFSATVPAGAQRKWTERRAVQLQLGDPAAVRLRVNGHTRTGGGNGATTPVTLALGPQHGTRR